MPILQTVGLSKSFLWTGKPRLILDSISFRMEAGTFVCIVGPSGCGKSTWLELLAGITKPDSGQIFYQGREITGSSGFLGYMPQDDLLFPWLNVTENALLPARINNLNLRASRSKIVSLLPVFGLQEHARHLPYQLSGGLRQRAAFLRTVMTETELLLLDEPFASLDAITRLQLQDWLKIITRKLNLSIILVTHDIDEAINLADEIHVFRGQPGRLAGCNTVDDALRNNQTARQALKLRILELVKSGIADADRARDN
ncbi:MAG TPA: ATP-binding cassette domain-containing protein [Candidatus Syntrophosphaera sp.]|nr:ATP-binding cassette domain-containing protein [Candidatus Syntrophosphaera sp.]